MLSDHDSFGEIVRASLPPGAVFDLSDSIGAAGLDSLRMARIAILFEEFIEAELSDSDLENLLTSRTIGSLIARMEAIALSLRPR